MYRLLVVTILVGVFGCGGGDSSPAAPTTTPKAPVYTLRLDTIQPASAQTVTFQRPEGRVNVSAEEIAVAIHVQEALRVKGASVEIRWDSDKLSYSNWYRGGFLEQDGANLVWSSSGGANSNYISFAVARPTSLAPVDGSGDLVVLVFMRKAGFRSGTTQLQWDTPRLDQVSCDYQWWLSHGQSCSYLFSREYFLNANIGVDVS